MSTEHNIFDGSYQAFGDLRSNQFYCVEFSAARVVQKCSATTALACGILQNNPNSGEVAVVRHLGMSKCVAGSGITVANLVGPVAHGAIGKKTPGTDTSNYVIGQAVETFSSGEVGPVIIRGTPLRAA